MISTRPSADYVAPGRKGNNINWLMSSAVPVSGKVRVLLWPCGRGVSAFRSPANFSCEHGSRLCDPIRPSRCQYRRSLRSPTV
jgi:hypothetical protein